MKKTNVTVTRRSVPAHVASASASLASLAHGVPFGWWLVLRKFSSPFPSFQVTH